VEQDWNDNSKGCEKRSYQDFAHQLGLPLGIHFLHILVVPVFSFLPLPSHIPELSPNRFWDRDSIGRDRVAVVVRPFSVAVVLLRFEPFDMPIGKEQV
jgi:hypothetical protein